MNSDKTDSAFTNPSISSSADAATSVPNAVWRSEDQLFAEYSPLLNYLAVRMSHGDEHLRQDLFQEGATGLIHAARRYDASKGATFPTFADRYIKGRMLHILRAERKHERCVPFPDVRSKGEEDEATQDDGFSISPREARVSTDVIPMKVECILIWEIINARFTDRQRQILALHYRDGFTVSEIAEQLNISPPRVSQVLKESVGKLQKVLVHN